MKRKILTALLSAVAAFSLWVYVVTVVSPEYEETFRGIPVIFQGESVLQEDRNLMLICEETPTVTLQLSGNRSDLTKLSSSNITVTVDLSKVYEAGTPELNYTVSYPGNVPNNAVTILNRSPEGIQLEIVERATKDIPVEVVYTGTLPENYIKEKPELDYATIQAKGPKATLEQIAGARIEVALDGATETITEKYTYTLCDEAGEPVDAKHIQTNLDSVNMTLPIKKLKEISLKLNVIYDNAVTAQNTTVTLDHTSVLISGSEHQLEGFDELVIGTVDLTTQYEDAVLTFPIELPEGIGNESGISEVRATVNLPNLATKTLKVISITPIHTPAGMLPSVSTQEIEITLRGPQAQIEAIDESALTVTVDLSAGQAGTNRYDATVTVSNRFPNVGVMGRYTVLAILTEIS